EARPDDRGGVFVLPRPEVARPREQGHTAAEAGEALGQLATDRPAAEDAEARGKLGEREDRLVGQVSGLLEAGDGRGRSPGPGAEGRPDEAERAAGDLQRPRAGEPPRAEEDVDAERARSE